MGHSSSGRDRTRTLRFCLILMIVLATGCAHLSAFDGEQMYSLASNATKLSAAVEATVRYEKPPEDVGDDQLIALATKEDPGLRKPFEEYVVRTHREAGHSVVLVCTKDGKIGLLEDAGCTAVLDSHLWRDKPQSPCEFSLSPAKLCRN